MNLNIKQKTILVLLLLSISLYPIAWLGFKLGRDLDKEMQEFKAFCTFQWHKISKILSIAKSAIKAQKKGKVEK